MYAVNHSTAAVESSTAQTASFSDRSTANVSGSAASFTTAVPHVALHLQTQNLQYIARNLSEGLARYAIPIKSKRFSHIQAFFPGRMPFLDLDRMVSSTPANETDVDPVRIRLHEGDWSIKRSYTLAEALRAASVMENPFAHFPDMVRDIFAVCAGRSIDKDSKLILQQIGAVLDACASFSKHVLMMHTLGTVFRIGADSLEGRKQSKEDASALAMAIQNVMAFKRSGRTSIFKALQAGNKLAAKRGGKVNEAFRESLRPDPSPPLSGQEAGHQGEVGRPFQTKTTVPKRPITVADVKPSLQGTDVIAYMYFRQIRPKALARAPEETAATGALPQKETQATGNAGERFEEPVEEAAEEAVEEVVAPDPLSPDKDEPEDLITDSLVFVYTEYHGDPDVAAPPPKARTHPAPTPSKPRYSWIEDVPVELRRAPQQVAEWRTLNLGPYRIEGEVPRETTFFTSRQREYIQLDGHVYAVRELVAGRWWIVSRTDKRLPHIPLVRDGDGDGWRIKDPPLFESIDPVDFPDLAADEDGFVRRAGEKFIRYGSKIVEVERSFITGEADIATWAEIPVGSLGSPNEIGIFELSGGLDMIEGEHGYYRLIADDKQGQFYIGDTSGIKRARVEYSLDTGQWSVIKRIRGEPELGIEAAPEGIAGFDEPAMPAGSEPVPSERRDGKALPRAGEREAPRKAPGASGNVMVENALDRRILRRADSETLSAAVESLQTHYFFHTRPRLASKVKKSLKVLSDLALLLNDPVALDTNSNWVIGIRTIREEMAKLIRDTPKWDQKSIVQKQFVAAEAARVTYNRRIDDGAIMVAHCNEMADLVYAELAIRKKFRSHFLQIFFKESTGMTHVLVLYADRPVLLEKFGLVHSTDPMQQVALPKLNKERFRDWIFEHRNEVLMIDPWGKKKILDFSDVVRIQDVTADLDALVKSADFTDVQQRYTVQALLPVRRVPGAVKNTHHRYGAGMTF